MILWKFLKKESWLQKCHIEEQISNWIGKNESAPTTVLLQAGAVAPYLVLRLRQRFLKTRFIDGGLAFSIAAPDDLLKDPGDKFSAKKSHRLTMLFFLTQRLPKVQNWDLLIKSEKGSMKSTQSFLSWKVMEKFRS